MSQAANIIDVTFGGDRRTATEALYQYDYGQILNFTDLDLPAEFEIDFAHARCSVSETYIGSNNQVTIPSKFLAVNGSVNAFIFLHSGEDDGETEYVISIPVKARPERTDPVPSEAQRSRIDELIEQMDEAVESAQQSAEQAQSIVDGIEETVEQAVDDYMAEHPVEIPVDSVNGKTGAVVLSASDVGAATKSELASTEMSLRRFIDSVSNDVTTVSGNVVSLSNNTVHLSAQTLTDAQKTQARQNISAITASEAPVQSVNGQTGAVTISTATTSSNGLMSSTDKSRLDDLYADYSSALTALGVI